MDSSSHVTQGLLVNLSNKRESRSVAVWPSLVVPSEEWFIAVSRTGEKKSWESLGPVWRSRVRSTAADQAFSNEGIIVSLYL